MGKGSHPTSPQLVVVVDDRRSQSEQVIRRLLEMVPVGIEVPTYKEVALDGSLIDPGSSGNSSDSIDSFESDGFSEDLVDSILQESGGESSVFIDLALTKDEDTRANREGNYDGEFVPFVASTVIQSLANRRADFAIEPRVYVYTTVPQLRRSRNLIKQRLVPWVNAVFKKSEDLLPIRWFPWASLRSGDMTSSECKTYLETADALFWVKTDGPSALVASAKELVDA